MLRVRNLTLGYGGAPVLADLDLDVAAGAFASLVGPSGSGKTSVLRAVTGLQTPERGLVEVDATRREIGFLFQDDALLPWRRVCENASLGLRIQGMERAAAMREAEGWLARLGLDGLGRRWPRQLSGGQRKRVAIAQVMALRPRLLLMDEPFAALDEITRFRLNDDLARLWEAERFTVVFVTHSVFESVYLAQRVVVMAARPGRVSQVFDVQAPDGGSEGFRTSAACAGQCRAVSDGLARAMAA